MIREQKIDLVVGRRNGEGLQTTGAQRSTI